MSNLFINIPKKGDKFVFTKKFKTGYTYDFLEGTKFKIVKFTSKKVRFKIISTLDELTPVLEMLCKSNIAQNKKTIKEVKFCIDLWNKDSSKFEILFNRFTGTKKHGINTGYPVPKDHPETDKDRFSEDIVLTHDYKHKDNVLNKYSYQSGHNEYYNKTVYEFMLKKYEQNLTQSQQKSGEYYKYLYSIITKKSYEFTIEEITKASIKKIK